MSARLHLDANVVLRFLRNDHGTQSPAAQRLFADAKDGNTQLLLSAVTVAEIFYVFIKTYKHSRPDAVSKLVPLLQSSVIEVDKRDRVLDTLQRAASANVDFGDAYLAASAAECGESVASFDGDLLAFKDINTIVPR